MPNLRQLSQLRKISRILADKKINGNQPTDLLSINKPNLNTNVESNELHESSIQSHKLDYTSQGSSQSNNNLIVDKSPLILDIIKNVDSSVRLVNCLNKSEFPFKTVADYVNHHNPLLEVMHIRNAGKKTAYELDNIIQEFIANPNKYVSDSSICFIENKAIEQRIRTKALELFIKYNFFDAILSQNISTRLRNVLELLKEQDIHTFRTLADCISQINKFDLFFTKQQFMGRKTLVELKRLIFNFARYILEKGHLSNDEQTIIFALLANEPHTLNDINKNEILEKLELIDQYTSPSDLNLLIQEEKTINLEHFESLDDASIISLIKNILDEREFDVIKRRTGLELNKYYTLEEISESYNCTRERIRQIEKKSLKKLLPLNNIFLNLLEKYEAQISSALFEDANYLKQGEHSRHFKKLSGICQLSILVAYKKFDSYLNSEHIKYKDFWINSLMDEEGLAIIKNSIDDDRAGISIKMRIIDALYEMSLPIYFKDLETKLPDISSATLKDSLKNHLDANTLDEIVYLNPEKLSSSLRFVLIMRSTGRAISLSEVKSIHSHMFNIDVSEHVAGAVLGRLKQVLIVGRGKYSLYENITLNKKDIATICSTCWNYLNRVQAYVSCKRIFEVLFLGRHSYGIDFNPYMLLGILQDDSRFVAKRGLMLGLNTFSENEFKGLTDHIYEIVDDHGPIDIGGIQEFLTERRKVLDATIGVMLDSSVEYIKIAPARYDRISRVIGNEETCSNLKFAVEIALLDQHLSLFSLEERLSFVGFNLNKYVITSWVDKQENIERNKNFIRLISPSKDVSEYNNKFIEAKNIIFNSKKNLDDLKCTLEDSFPFLVKSDYRLTGKDFQIGGEDETKDNELDDFFKELDF